MTHAANGFEYATDELAQAFGDITYLNAVRSQGSKNRASGADSAKHLSPETAYSSAPPCLLTGVKIPGNKLCSLDNHWLHYAPGVAR